MEVGSFAINDKLPCLHRIEPVCHTVVINAENDAQFFIESYVHLIAFIGERTETIKRRDDILPYLSLLHRGNRNVAVRTCNAKPGLTVFQQYALVIKNRI